jgi:hypothetical protein
LADPVISFGWDMSEIQAPAGAFIDELSRLDTFVQVTLEGFGYSLEAERLTDTIRSIVTRDKNATPHPVADDDVCARTKASAKRLGDFARSEAAGGHSYLFSLAIIRLYSIIEGAVDATFIAAVRSGEEHGPSEALSRLKGPLLPFLTSTEDERAEILRQRLVDEVGARQKVGLARFETILSGVNLQGHSIPETISRAFLELSEIRHLVVHRRAQTDKKFMDRCPWLAENIGQPVNPSGWEFRTYSDTSLWYLIDLGQRWRGTSDPDLSTQYGIPRGSCEQSTGRVREHQSSARHGDIQHRGRRLTTEWSRRARRPCCCLWDEPQ